MPHLWIKDNANIGLVYTRIPKQPYFPLTHTARRFLRSIRWELIGIFGASFVMVALMIIGIVAVLRWL